MEKELNRLAQKLHQLIELKNQLAQENLALKNSLAQAQQENLLLQEKIHQASDRVEQLIADLPEAVL
jgi:uncharacterized protein (TIGR02449 family)